MRKEEKRYRSVSKSFPEESVFPFYICLSFPPFFDIVVSAPFIVNHPLSYPSLPCRSQFLFQSLTTLFLCQQNPYLSQFLSVVVFGGLFVFFFKKGFIIYLLPFSLPPLYVFVVVSASICVAT